jgi:acetyltransferase-like isoleucine patch superfamily enzyme
MPFLEYLHKMNGYIRGFLLRRKICTDGYVCSVGKTIVRNRGGRILVGNRTCLWPNVKLAAIANEKCNLPLIKIGKYSSLGDRTQIHCGESVNIGDYVLIAWDVNIIEFDYHASGGKSPVPRPILIEDEVWVCPRSIILKGVTIGKGAIVATGSVVTKDVPAFTLVAGNPARPIRTVASWRGTVAPECVK